MSTSQEKYAFFLITTRDGERSYTTKHIAQVAISPNAIHLNVEEALKEHLSTDYAGKTEWEEDERWIESNDNERAFCIEDFREISQADYIVLRRYLSGESFVVKSFY